MTLLTPADYMNRALFLAARGRGRTSPNPLVGAVIASPDGTIVGQGSHERAGEPHAEIHALDMAGSRARGATLYCTLEPCCHVGRTGPCVARITGAGIRRVVAAIEDPNPVVCGRGFAFLREHGIEVEVGLGAEAAARLNQPFLTLIRKRRPFVILKAATSLDGRIAASLGMRTKLTSVASDRHAHRVRAEVDAVGIGSGTVLIDDPLLTPRGAFRERPLTRVIFDRRLRTPPHARVLSTLEVGPVIIVTVGGAVSSGSHARSRAFLEKQGARIVVAVDASLKAALECLGTLGIGSLLLEGGAAVHRAAWDDGLVDFVRLYVTPCVLGHGAVPLMQDRGFRTADLVERRIEPLGDDVLIEGYVHRPY